MVVRYSGLVGGVVSVSMLLIALSTGPASAQDRRQECSTRYQAAKAAGELKGLTWPQFFSKCMLELKEVAPAAVEAKPPVSPPPAAAVAPAEAPPPAAAVETQTPPKPATAPTMATPAPTSPEIVSPLRPTPSATPMPAETAAPSPAPLPTPQAPAPETVAAPVDAPPVPLTRAEPGAAREPVFPTAIAPAYAKLDPRIGRQKTCLDQYNANKATDSNAGLKWTQKGGGYASLCIQHLKASR